MRARDAWGSRWRESVFEARQGSCNEGYEAGPTIERGRHRSDWAPASQTASEPTFDAVDYSSPKSYLEIPVSFGDVEAVTKLRLGFSLRAQVEPS